MKDIRKFTEVYRNNLIKFLRDIIAIRSMNGDEEAVIKRVRNEMETLGYDRIEADGLGNLFGFIGSGRRLLAIDCHCDTVDIGNPDNWDVDPFKGDMRDGYIYGRGASDQKSGLACAVYAGKVLKDVGVPDDVTVVVCASVLEEDYEGISWRYILGEKVLQPEAVLLTEPTELGVRIGQRGRIEIKVTTRGVSCHGSAPGRGENAVYKMAPIISEIEQLNKRLMDDPVLGNATITISDIRSTAPSLCAVADSATIHLDRRLTAGDTFESALAEIKELSSVKNSGAEISIPEYEVKAYTGIVFPQSAYYPMWLMDEDHWHVKSAVKTYMKQFGSEPVLRPWVFSTNGVSIMGEFNIPTVGFGPGEEKEAHSPNEKVRIDDLVKAVEYYAAFVQNWRTD